MPDIFDQVAEQSAAPDIFDRIVNPALSEADMARAMAPTSPPRPPRLPVFLRLGVPQEPLEAPQTVGPPVQSEPQIVAMPSSKLPIAKAGAEAFTTGQGAQDVKNIWTAIKSLAGPGPENLPSPLAARTGLSVPKILSDPQRQAALAQGIESAFDMATPAMVAGAVASPLAAAEALVTGYAASKVGEEGVKALGGGPEAQRLGGDLGWLVGPAAFTRLVRPRAGLEVGPQGTRAAVEALGGQAGAGVAVTPEQVAVRGKVGPLEVSKTFARKAKAPAAPAIEPPTIEGTIAPTELARPITPEVPPAEAPPAPKPDIFDEVAKAPEVQPSERPTAAPVAAETRPAVPQESQPQAEEVQKAPEITPTKWQYTYDNQGHIVGKQPAPPESPRIDYDQANKIFARQKAALTRALNIQDPDARRIAVVGAAKAAVKEWNEQLNGMWPDQWSRWQRAVDDQFATFNGPRLEDIENWQPEAAKPEPIEQITKPLAPEKPSAPGPGTPEYEALKKRLAELEGKQKPAKAAKPVPAPPTPAVETPIPGGFTKGETVLFQGKPVTVVKNESITWANALPIGPRGGWVAGHWGGERQEMIGVRDAEGNYHIATPQDLTRQTPEVTNVEPKPQAEVPAAAGTEAVTGAAPRSQAVETRGEKPKAETVEPNIGDTVEYQGQKWIVRGKEGAGIRLVNPDNPRSFRFLQADQWVDLKKVEPTPPKSTLPPFLQKPKTPQQALVEKVTGAVESGKAEPIVGIPAPEAKPVPEPERGSASLANAVYEKLKAGESLGNVTELNRLAEEHFGAGRTSGKWSPKDAFDAMEAGVNKYLVDRGQLLMSVEPDEAIRELKDLQTRITSQGVRTEEQIKNQQFSTPPTEAYLVAKVADIKPSDVVLEPSAGNGGLAVLPKAAGAKVYVNEIAPRRQEMLKLVGFDNVTAHDAEYINANLERDIKPTVIVMNPPFSASTQKSYEAKNTNLYGFNHVEQALQRLEPGGRLVTILGGGQANEPEGGASLTSGSAGKWFNQMAERYNVLANVRINGKEYQKYGTNFATRIVVFDKTTPSFSQYGTDWRSHVIKGNVDTVEQAYNLLRNVPAREATNAAAIHPESEPAGRRPAESGVGLHPNANVPGVRVPAGRSPATHGEVPAPSGPNGPRPVAPEARPAGGNQPVSVPQPESRPQERPQVETAGRAGGGAENGHERPLADRGRDLELIEERTHQAEEEGDESAFTKYQPTLKGGTHPGDIVETKAMATVPMPPITYKPALPESVTGKPPDYKDAKISNVQLEAVAIAGMQNDIVLKDGSRAAALIGDGTGVGKGREGAAIILDNWNKGRRRLVWVTKSKDLIDASIRDLEAIGAKDLAKNIRNLGKIDVRTPIEHEGVLFTTYSLFRSQDKKGNTRAAQIDKWLRGNDEGEGGYLLMDESHNLKNAVVAQGGQASQIGEVMKKFLENMPKLRTVSLSATAATDVMNLGYLDRLGLWGPGTPFPGGFQQFAGEIAHGGMSAMEMIARELKAQGKYAARTLTYRGVKYTDDESTVHPLTPEQEKVYEAATEAWRSVSASIENTIQHTTNGGSRQRGFALAQFYSAQQRFFSLLLTSLKIPKAVELANKALDEGKSVGITLINTNEAAQNRERNRIAEEESDEEPDYDFGPGRLLIDMVKEHYPTQQYKDDVDANGNHIKVPMYETGPDGKPTSKPLQNPEAIKARDALIAKLERELHMPANPLDELIEQLGGPSKVAELTGRKQRYDPTTNRLVNRASAGVSQDKVNRAEMAAFQEGKKRIAILSSAADTGISLHSDKGAKNKQQRYVITLQVGWSADKAMQMMGRFHRSNQVVPPEYALLKSNMGGESRFISSIARRMESLEALSKGQTKTNAGTEGMSKVNFETDQGRAATVAFYNRLLGGEKIPGLKEAAGEEMSSWDVLEELGVLKDTPRGRTVPPAERDNTTRLLNRLLALKPKLQNAVYDYFYDIFDATVKDAIENGTLDTGVKRIPGDSFAVKEFREIATDPTTGAKTFYYPVEAQERMTRTPVKEFERILDAADRRHDHPQILTNEKGQYALIVDARPIVKSDGNVIDAVHMVTPEDSVPHKVPVDSLEGKWHSVDREARIALQQAERAVDSAEEDIEQRKNNIKEYEETSKGTEGYRAEYWKNEIERQKERLKDAKQRLEEARKQRRAAKDQIEARPYMAQVKNGWQKQHDAAPTHKTANHHLVGGAVMRYWNAIRESIPGRMDVYSTVDAKTKQRVVGIEIPATQIQRLLARISGGKSLVDSSQIIPDVLENGTTYDLEGGIKIRRGRVSRENVVQLVTGDRNALKNLQSMGVVSEYGAQPIHYLPTEKSFGGEYVKAREILDKILKEYPVKQEKPATQGEVPGPGAMNKRTKKGEDVGSYQLREVTAALKRIGTDNPVEKIRLATKVADLISHGKSKIQAASDRMKAVGQAVIEGFLHHPEKQTSFDQDVNYWAGEKQIIDREVEQFTHTGYRLYPKEIREAMVNAMEADAGVNLERAKTAQPQFKAGYERAAKLSDEERTGVSNFQVLMDHALEEAKKYGVLEHGVLDYIQHIWNRVPKKVQAWWDGKLSEINYSILQPNPSFTRRRIWETYYEGEQKGATPKAKDAVYLVGHHLRSLYHAINDRRFIKQQFSKKASDGRPRMVVGGGAIIPEPESMDPLLIKPHQKGKDYGDYVFINHPAFHKWKWAGEDDQGRQIFMQGDVYAHKEIAPKLKNILEPSAIQQHPIGRALLKTQGFFKASMLRWVPSMFHATTIKLHGMEHTTFGAPEIDVRDPLQNKLIHSGLMLWEPEGAEAWSEGLAVLSGKPGLGGPSRQFNYWLFHEMIPRVKMAMARHAYARNKERYPSLSDYEVAHLTSEQANAAFGGLNYYDLGRSRTMQDVLRLMLLAPDFFEARARFAGQAGKGYGREQLRALFLGAAGLYVMARIMNQLLDEQPHWDRPFSIVYKGHEYSFRTVQADLYHLVTEPSRFFMSRLAPLESAALEFLSKRDWTGKRRDPVEQLYDFAQRVAPIPSQEFVKAIIGERRSPTVRDTITQALKWIGINVRQYRTDAEQKALELKEPSSASRERPQGNLMTQYRRQIHDQEFDRKQLDQDVKAGKLTPKDRSNLLQETRKPQLTRSLSEMPLADALKVWKEMSPEEQKQNRALMIRKANHEIARYPVPLRAQKRQEVFAILNKTNTPLLPGFLRWATKKYQQATQ